MGPRQNRVARRQPLVGIGVVDNVVAQVSQASLTPGGLLNDMVAVNLSSRAAMVWEDVTNYTSDQRPSPRRDHGLAEAGGLLYVFGGDGYASGERPPPAK